MPRWMIFVHLLLLFPLFSQSQSNNSQELRKDQEVWGKRRQKNMGTHLNPVMGTSNADARATEAYIYSIVEKMLGEKLKAFELPIVLTLWSTNEAKIGHRFHDVSTENRFLGEIRFLEETRMIRRSYTGSETSHFYEVSLSAGLLNNIKSEAELAFLVGLEYLKVFREEEKRQWNEANGFSADEEMEELRNKQAEKLAYDKEMIDRMTNHYKLENIVEALDRIAEGRFYNTSFLAGALFSNVHPSVRSALLMGYINKRYRENIGAYAIEAKPLPEYTLRLGNHRTNASMMHFETFKRNFVKYAVERMPHVNEALKADFDLGTAGANRKNENSWLRLFVSSQQQNQIMAANEGGFEVTLSANQAGELIVEIVEALKSAPLSKQQKVDAFLLSLFVLNSKKDTRIALDFTRVLNIEKLGEIRRFLAEQSIGEGAWKSDVFVDKFGQMTEGWQGSQRVSRIVFEPYNMRKSQVRNFLFSDLVEQFSEWRKLFTREYRESVRRRESMAWGDAMDAIRLEGNRGANAKLIESKYRNLQRIVFEALIDELKKEDLRSWLKEGEKTSVEGVIKSDFESLYRTLSYYKKREKEKVNTEVFEAFKKVVEPHVPDYREQRLADLDRLIGRDSQRIEGNLTEIDNRVNNAVYDLAEEGLLNKDIFSRTTRGIYELVREWRENFAVKSTKTTDLNHSIISHRSFSARANKTPRYLEFLINQAAGDSMGPNEKMEVLIYAMARNSYNAELEIEDREAKESLERIAKDIPVESLLESLYDKPKSIEASFHHFIKKIYGAGVLRSDYLATIEGLHSQAEKTRATFRSFMEGITPSHEQMIDPKFDQNKIWEAHNHQLIFEHFLNWQLRRRIGILRLIGVNPKAAKIWAKKFSLEDYQELVRALHENHRQAQMINELWKGQGWPRPATSTQGSRFLYELFLLNQSRIEGMQKWYQQYRLIRDMNREGQSMDPRYGEALVEELEARLGKMNAKEAYTWMRKTGINELFETKRVADFVQNYIKEKAKNGASRVLLKDVLWAVGRDFRMLHLEVEGNEETTNRSAALLQELKKRVSKDFNLQPGEVDRIFWQDQRNDYDKAGVGGNHTRALSAMVARTHAEDVSKQLDMIRYLVGFSDKMPAFVAQPDNVLWANDKKSLGVIVSSGSDKTDAQLLVNATKELRNYMGTATAMERAIIVSSFLAGPDGLMNNSSAVENMIEYIIRDLTEERKEFARLVAKSILDAEGASRSLALAFFFAQPTQEGGVLTEGQLLRALGMAYGVPSHKLSQYLSFSYPEYQKELESFQDSEMEPRYLDVLRLLEESFGPRWPKNFRVIKLLGAGSVNLAILFENIQTGEVDVLQIARKDIVKISQYDFHRINLMMDRMIANAADPVEYEFMKGLLGVVEESVKLEFDKEQAHKMQNVWNEVYRTESNGWQVRSVPGHYFEEKNRSLFMGLAQGKTAYKVEKTHPNEFREAMRAVVEAEFDVLRGVHPNEKAKGLMLFANPDMHLGQVLIDVEKHTVTIIDPGQAVFIDEFERNMALRLLLVANRMVGAGEASEMLREISSELYEREPGKHQSDSATLEAEEIRDLWQSRDNKVDRIMRIVSLLNIQGVKVPIATIHWIMAIHRLDTLGKRVGKDFHKRMAAILMAEKFLPERGVPVYNGGEKMLEWVTKHFRQTEITTRQGYDESRQESYQKIFSLGAGGRCEKAVRQAM